MTPVKELLAMDYPQYLEIETDIMTLHSTYVKYKHEHNLMDYDDLLLNLMLLLRQERSSACNTLRSLQVYYGR